MTPRKSKYTTPRVASRPRVAKAAAPSAEPVSAEPAPATPVPAPARAIDPDLAARDAAFEVLQCVVLGRRAVNDTFDAAVKALEPRDRAFVRMLVATTLRRLGQIDAVLSAFITRPPPDEIRDCLRLGAAQTLFLGTPPHAAVATTVALSRVRGPERFTGLVNAVSRKLVVDGPAMVAEQDAARLNCPDWLWQSWAQTYGDDVAAQIALAHLGEPPVDFSLKDSTTADSWAAKLEATPLVTGSLRRFATGRVTDMDGFKDGGWWVQDAAAALPAKILLHAMQAAGGKTIVDLCAAPGGKTAQMAAAGYKVTSVDLAESRVALLRDNIVRTKLYADIVTADALTWRPAAPADGVLLDAPCSATGTIRRHPDLPFLKQEGDIAGFALNQRRLLAAAVDMVKPGGFILYSVCSLQPEEGDGVVNAVLADDTRLSRVAISPDAIGGAAELLTPEGVLRTLPCHWAQQGGMDGFYGALLRRES